jgi:AcrR family transcriptional regulator
MSSTEAREPRRRLSREDRHRQLMDVAWRLIREEGTEALTLGRLAEQAGITKPVVYDHFGTRTGLLIALYREFDDRQTEQLQAALQTGEPTLAGRAAVIAAAYVGCVLAQGREIPGVVAALTSSPELEKVKRECDAAFRETCRDALAPFAPAGAVSPAGLRAMLGAAEALSAAAAHEELSAAEARAELAETIVAMVSRRRG